MQHSEHRGYYEHFDEERHDGTSLLLLSYLTTPVPLYALCQARIVHLRERLVETWRYLYVMALEKRFQELRGD